MAVLIVIVGILFVASGAALVSIGGVLFVQLTGVMAIGFGALLCGIAAMLHRLDQISRYLRPIPEPRPRREKNRSAHEIEDGRLR